MREIVLSSRLVLAVFDEVRKTFSLTPYVGRSCLLNVGANNVASVYRENRKSQKAIAIKNARRGMREKIAE